MPFNFSAKEKYEMWCMEQNIKTSIPVSDVPNLFIDDEQFLAMLQDRADRNLGNIYHEPF